MKKFLFILNITILFFANTLLAKKSLLEKYGIDVDIKRKIITIEAEVALQAGILEFFLCKENTKDYESVFKTRATPSKLQIALILIGMENYQTNTNIEEIDWKKILRENPPIKSLLEIYVEWKDKKGFHKVKAEEFLFFRETQTVLNNIAWIFTGSVMDIYEKRIYYAADYTGAMIALWPNPTAIINIGMKTRNPYRGENFGFEVNYKKVPPLGTKVKIIIKPKYNF